MSTGNTNAGDTPLQARLFPTLVKITEIPGQTSLGTFTVIVENPAEGADITLSSIIVTLPMGAQATDIAAEGTEKSMKANPTLNTWDYKFGNTKGQFNGTPHSGKTIILTKGTSIGLRLTNIQLSNLEGDCVIDIKIMGPEREQIANYKPKLGKVYDRKSEISLRADPPNPYPGKPVKLTYNGKGITKFTMHSSKSHTPLPIPYEDKGGEITENPLVDTEYTLDGQGEDVLLQAQVKVAILRPSLIGFRTETSLIDEGGDVILTWDTAFADNVILSSDNPRVKFPDPFPAHAKDPKVIIKGIQDKVTITAYAVKFFPDGNIESDRQHAHIGINDPQVVSFTIAAEPLTPGQRCTFKLNWDIKNAGSYRIYWKSKEKSGELTGLEPKQRETTVTPESAETTYKLEVYKIGLPHPEEELTEA